MNGTATCRIPAIWCSRLALMRLAPFSYFCTCWNVMPSSSPSLPGSFTEQISRGKTDRLRRTPAGSTTPIFDDCGLRDHQLARPIGPASLSDSRSLSAGSGPDLDCRQSFQYFLSNLTSLLPRAEPVVGFFHWKSFVFAKNLPGVSLRLRTPVFYFHSKMIRGRGSVHGAQLPQNRSGLRRERRRQSFSSGKLDTRNRWSGQN